MPRPHPRLAPPPAPIAPHHLSTAPLPPAPIGLASPASPLSRPPCADIRIPLCRHRADSALIAPPSRPSCAAAVLYVLRFAVRIAPTVRRHPRHPLALRRPRGPGWQEPRRMHPFFAECAKKALFLATSARNACFSRSRWQHPRPMHPFPGAIGRFRIHGARILPPRALFRVEEPEITHGAKVLPAPRGLSAAAACGPAELALRHAARAWPACRMRPPLSSRLCPPRPAVRPNGLCALLSRFAARIAPTHAAIRRAAHCGRDELPNGLRRPRPATRSPYRCISPPARRTHPASRAHPPRPGNKRNSTNNSMRA